MTSQRRNWTAEEDELLKTAVAKAQLLTDIIAWSDVAKHVPGRSNRDCRKRWVNTLASAANVGPWSASEDERLADAVQSEGTRWTRVSAKVRTRNGDQCAKHWTQTSDPQINRGEWTEEEDRRLMQAFQLHGPNWSFIQQRYFPCRSALASKNRYSGIARKHKTAKAGPNAQASTRQSSSSNAAPSTSSALESQVGAQEEPIFAGTSPETTATTTTTTTTSTTSPFHGPTGAPTAGVLNSCGATNEGRPTTSPPWWDSEMAMDDLVLLSSASNDAPASAGAYDFESSQNRANAALRLPEKPTDTTRGASGIDSMDLEGAHGSDYGSNNWFGAVDASTRISAVPELLCEHTPPSGNEGRTSTAVQISPSSRSNGTRGQPAAERPLYDADSQLRSEPLRKITIRATCNGEQLGNIMRAVVAHSVSWEMSSD